MRPILFLASLWVAVSLNLSVHGQEAGLFNEVLTLLNESGLAFDEARARRAAANALVHSADPLGDLLTEAQAIALKEYQSGRIHDSGIRLMVTNGVFYVRRMDPGSPALHAGVNVGDELRAIDDRKIIHKRFSEVIERLRADHERELKLTLAGSEGPVRDIVLTLRPVQLNTIEISEEFPSGICYIKINGLYEEGAAAMVNQLRNWEQQNKTGIILDLRDAGGRELTTVQEIAAQFAQPNSPLFTLQNISLNQAQKYESGDTRPITVPAMLLINKRTTGAAELLVATLKGCVNTSSSPAATSSILRPTK
jgi:carboxyl-terminal processing protease